MYDPEWHNSILRIYFMIVLESLKLLSLVPVYVQTFFARISLAVVAKDSEYHPFQKTLQPLIIQTASQHPFHVIYVLIALRNAELSQKDPSVHVCPSFHCEKIIFLSRFENILFSCTHLGTFHWHFYVKFFEEIA